MKQLPHLPHRQPRSALAALVLLLAAAIALAACGGSSGGGDKTIEEVFGAQNNQLIVYDTDTGAHTILIPAEQNNVNGQACQVPDGSGNFIMGEDTNQTNGIRQGWGFFAPDGSFVGKILEPVTEGEAKQIEPFGCAFDTKSKLLFTTDVGSGDFAAVDGKLMVYFPPDYGQSCVLESKLHVPGTVAVDDTGSVYVPETVPPGHVLKYSPPFPTDGSSCDSTPLNKSTFIDDKQMTTPFGIARAPNGNWYVTSVLLPPEIREYTPDGKFVRTVLSGDAIGNPTGIAVTKDGTIYYSDIGLEPKPAPQFFGPGDKAGTVRRVTLDKEGNASTPEIINQGLDYPDAVSVLNVKRDTVPAGTPPPGGTPP